MSYGSYRSSYSYQPRGTSIDSRKVARIAVPVILGLVTGGWQLFRHATTPDQNHDIGDGQLSVTREQGYDWANSHFTGWANVRYTGREPIRFDVNQKTITIDRESYSTADLIGQITVDNADSHTNVIPQKSCLSERTDTDDPYPTTTVTLNTGSGNDIVDILHSTETSQDCKIVIRAKDSGVGDQDDFEINYKFIDSGWFDGVQSIGEGRLVYKNDNTTLDVTGYARVVIKNERNEPVGAIDLDADITKSEFERLLDSIVKENQLSSGLTIEVYDARHEVVLQRALEAYKVKQARRDVEVYEDLGGKSPYGVYYGSVPGSWEKYLEARAIVAQADGKSTVRG